MTRFTILLATLFTMTAPIAWADGEVCSQIPLGQNYLTNIGVILPENATGVARRLQTRWVGVAGDAWLDCQYNGALNGLCNARTSIGASQEQKAYDEKDKNREVWWVLIGNSSLVSWIRYCVAYTGTSEKLNLSNFSKDALPGTKLPIKDSLPTSTAAKKLLMNLKTPDVH